MAIDLTYLDAIEIVLHDVGKPLTAREITDEILARQIVNVAGKTPWKTVAARISEDIRVNGAKSRFKRAAAGQYVLRTSQFIEYEAIPRRLDKRFNSIKLIDAAIYVLGVVGIPMTTRQMVVEINNRRLVPIKGKTAWETLNAQISTDIKNNGEKSQFKRVERGKFTLRSSPGDEYIAKPHQRHIPQKIEVFVFPTEILDDPKLGHFHGIRKDYNPYAYELLNTNILQSMPRNQAEKDIHYKQIVSYLIITYEDLVLRYIRGSVTNVDLHREYTIGLGGHLEGQDWRRDLFDFDRPQAAYQESIFRELSEEIQLGSGTQNEFIKLLKDNIETMGVLNDDSTPLGTRHFAFLHRVKLPEFHTFRKREKSINELGFVKISSLGEEFHRYEYWSKLYIQNFFADQLSFSCHVDPKPNFFLRQQQDILLIVGHIGSGKTEACSLLEREFGYTLVPCSRVLRELLGCGPIEQIGRKAMQDLGYKFINENGAHERLARGIVDYMRFSHGHKFVLDGLRYPETLTALRSLIPIPITVLYIESTIDNLYEYYKARHAKEAEELSFRDFLDIVYHPVEREIQRFGPRTGIPNVTFYNHGSLDSYLATIRKYFSEQLG